MNNKTKKELQEKIKEQSEHINFLEHTIEYMYNDEQVIDLIVSWNCYKCMYFDCCGEQEIKHISPDISKFNFTPDIRLYSSLIERELKKEKIIINYNNHYCKEGIKNYLIRKRKYNE